MKITETFFNYVFGVTVIGVIGYLVGIGNIDKNTVIGMLGSVGFNIALILGIGFGLQKFQMGFGRNIQNEIYDENNIAAAIYQAGIWVALGLVIAKGL